MKNNKENTMDNVTVKFEVKEGHMEMEMAGCEFDIKAALLSCIHRLSMQSGEPVTEILKEMLEITEEIEEEVEGEMAIIKEFEEALRNIAKVFKENI